jgi:hypothetical protein
MKKEKKTTPIVPDHKKGKKMNTRQKVKTSGRNDAVKLFEEVKQRLTSINNWKELCGFASAEFTLTDANGNIVNKEPEKGDYIRIKLPAPGPPAGDGYDWVQIEKMENSTDEENDIQRFAFRVRPSDNPANNKSDTAHFYTDAATSSFVVERNGRNVTASVYGRNEVPNTSQTKGVINKARNAVVGITAIAGIAKPQWKSLVNGLLGVDDERQAVDDN